MIYTIGLAALFLWAFWYFYIIVMGLYRAHLQGRLSWPLKILGAPALLIGYTMDVLAQYTLATLIFWDLPRRGERVVTKRLQRYIAGPWEGNRWRKRLAMWVCDHLLDVFDPTGEHC